MMTMLTLAPASTYGLINIEAIIYASVMFLIVFCLTFQCYYRKNFHVISPRKEKTPTKWPIFGMLPSLLLNVGRLHQYITDALQQSGGTFYFQGPWFANVNMLITSDPANVHYILTKNFPNFSKGPDFKKMFDILGEGIFIAESESWENQRRTAKPLINSTGFVEFVTTTTINKVETALVPVLEMASKTGLEVDVQELFKRFTFDCSCILVLGHDPVSLSEDLPHLPHEKAFADAEEAVLYRHVLPEFSWKLQNWLCIGKENKLSKAKDMIHRFVTCCISAKFNSSMDEKHGFDMLTSYYKGGGVSISEDERKDTMLNLIFAGKDTISAALTWFFWLVATNPAEDEKIRQEILTNFPEGQKWKFTTMDDLKKLVYLHGALCETLRLFPPVPFQHKAPVKHDILPSGHRINPNTKTLISFYSMGRMESIWGKDCLEFKPRRWISDQTGRIKTEPSFKFTAFNAGPRTCLGKEISFIQLKIVAAAIMSRFKFQVVESHSISPSISVVLHMKHGLKVKVLNYA